MSTRNEHNEIMKTKPMLILLLGVLLGHEAQAFYNPNSGRWLNRDPLGDIAFFTLVSNDPANRVDQDGTTGWDPGYFARCCKQQPSCKIDPNFRYDDSPFVIYTLDLDQYIEELQAALNNAPTPPHATPDKWRHCMFICRTARNHRPLEAIAATLVSEFPFIRGGHSSINDFWANLQGLFCDMFSRETCSKSCACATQGAPYD